MFETFKNALKVPELRRKILYTLAMLLIFRIGSFIPLPGVNIDVISTSVKNFDILGLLDLMNGGSLSNFTIFAMGITPYINASIIIQLLTAGIPRLEEIVKEGGEEGRKKQAQWTRYATVVLALMQAVGIVYGFGSGAVLNYNFFTYAFIGISLSAGTAFCMWLGENITERGLGNGISLLIFVGIISRLPSYIGKMIMGIAANPNELFYVPFILIGILLLIAGVVYVDLGERRIPVQYAKRQVGRKMYGGQSTHIPMKVNATGVLPLIFAQSLVMLPGLIAQFWPTSGFYLFYTKWLGVNKPAYVIIFSLLIFFFTWFYTSITFNPTDIAKNMQENGGFIPGIRPGKPTSDYLGRISGRLSVFGGLFLALIALIPTLIMLIAGTKTPFGATSILIVVSVAIETTKQLESQMLQRHYKGFLK